MFFWDKPRSKKEYAIKRCERGEWNKFKKYHYLNSELPKASQCYGVYDNDNIIAFMGVIHQPHGINKKIKRVSRIVVLPDYQGIGIGTRFLTEIAKIYKNKGYDFSIVTSAKNMIKSLYKNDKWIMIRNSYCKCSSKKNAIDYKRKSMRAKCKTASFFYKGG